MAEGGVATFPIMVNRDSEMLDEHQILQPLNTLQSTLQGMPSNILQFSTTLRMLHNQTAVSGEHDSATKFLDIRDKTRKDALIYTNTLLPKTEDIVRKIRKYAYEICTFDFDEWHENLKEIAKEVTLAEKACKLLLKLHEDLIVELKKNEDDATVGIGELDKLKKLYEEEKQKLLNKAYIHLKNKEWYNKLGLILAIPTFGIGTWVLRGKAKEEQVKVDTNLLKATASAQNGEITQNAANLTENSLIPAIKNFLEGLTACSDFLTATREDLSEMVLNQDNAEGHKNKRYFKLIKNHAEDLNSNCMFFMTSSSHIRTDLKALPTEPNDKNYVDKWLEAQLKRFEKTNPGTNIIGTLMDQVKSYYHESDSSIHHEEGAIEETVTQTKAVGVDGK